MKSIQKLTFIGKLILISILGIYVVISFWLYFPYTPMQIKSPIKILNKGKTVEQGGILRYELDMIKKCYLPAIVSKQLLNDVIITYTPIIGNLPPGEYKKEFPLPIPKYAPGGKYRFKWEGYYKVNPLRRVKVSGLSEEFKVVVPVNKG